MNQDRNIFMIQCVIGNVFRNMYILQIMQINNRNENHWALKKKIGLHVHKLFIQFDDESS